MKKVLLTIALLFLSLIIVIIWQYKSFHDGKMHIVFCDVGQGDAIFIKTPNNKFILVDGGPDRAVSHCLARYMPFWSRQIDLMLLTHPHADHFFGMFYILDQYAVKAFATEDLVNKTQAYEALLTALNQRRVPQQFVSASDRWDVGNVQLQVVGPSEKYLAQTSPGGTIGESKEFASLIVQVTYGAFDVLLTGDSQVLGLQDANERITGEIEVLLVPHHGSGSGLDAEVLEQLRAKIAIISVGAKNRYNHPHPKILQLLTSAHITFFRTDQKGDIEIVSDGETWSIR